ncbi:glycosyltransferase family 2 protein [Candidatus Woesearchaeota archaeon]|nr:glycosyltransferase family 2 protein [Candidatus Woesearchaeota archaeon]
MISIIIPVFNEEKVIVQTIAEVKKSLASMGQPHEIIVVNDGSQDQSGTILKKVQGIKLITHINNKGYGASLKSGIRVAQGEKILITDADGTYPIERIPDLITKSSEFDMVVGARSSENVPLLRKPAKKILSMLANFLTGRIIPDLNSGMRIFNKDLALEFFHLFPNGFSFTTTITLAALTNNYSVEYVPIEYHKRIGKSTISPWNFFEFAALIVRLVMYFNPLKFFLTPGILLLIGGAGFGIWEVVQQRNLGEFPILLVITGLQICFLGLIADLIVKSRNARVK